MPDPLDLWTAFDAPRSEDIRRAEGSLQRFTGWLFSNPEEPISPEDVLAWWEARRLPFNVIVGMYGIVCLLIFCAAITTSGHLQPGEDAVEPLALFVAPILVNVLYTLGWIVERTARATEPERVAALRPAIVGAGARIRPLPHRGACGVLVWLPSPSVRRTRDMMVRRIEDRPVSGDSRWSRMVGWLPVAALGLVVFELTADPALGFAVGIVKVAGGDFKTALWVRRTDPNSRRGRACSWFFVARGCGRTGLGAIVVMTAVSMVVAAFLGTPLPEDFLKRELLGMVGVMLACGVLGAFAAWFGVESALRGGVRVWIDANASRARKNGLWPPFDPNHWRESTFGPRGIAMYGIATAPFAILALVGACVALALGVLAASGMNVDPLLPWAGIACGVGGLAGLCWSIRLAFLAHRTFARSAVECYREYYDTGPDAGSHFT